MFVLVYVCVHSSIDWLFRKQERTEKVTWMRSQRADSHIRKCPRSINHFSPCGILFSWTFKIQYDLPPALFSHLFFWFWPDHLEKGADHAVSMLTAQLRLLSSANSQRDDRDSFTAYSGHLEQMYLLIPTRIRICFSPPSSMINFRFLD